MLEDTDGALGKKVESKEQKEESVQEEKGRSKDRSSRKPKEKKGMGNFGFCLSPGGKSFHDRKIGYWENEM